ncbi:MAG: type II CRISPR RNA-guided endonuclease Cas9 [Planctomycetes bacterium RBG_13_46_10]|nr:CRISPR-associated protein Cas9 [uncultured bacterium]OHB61334.1 MAG: type II CRISPR RNA-guided endonuclease Cas9 [Planctomycetes bacterium RBG_13_46_10]
MSTEKVVLGLDVGVSSIGWGIVKLQEGPYQSETADGKPDTKPKIVGGEIIRTGVRTFQLPEDRQKKSLALIRGSARRTRRTIKRKVQRMNRLINLAKEFKLIGEDFDRDSILKPQKGTNKKEKWDIWLIRKEALERKLTDTELFRVLYHIAKHRGAYFHTKAEFLPEEDEKELNKNQKQKKEESKEGNEKEKVKKGLRRIQKMLKDSKYRTIGALFYEMFKQTNSKGSNKKRNAPDKYENSIRRELLCDEIVEIFERQRELKNPKAVEEFKHRYIDDILMREKEVDEDRLRNMMSRCEFTGDLCAPKESYTAERFTLFNRLNTLATRDGNNKNCLIPLDNSQRDKIIALAYKNAEVNFSQIRNELEWQDKPHLTFNLCSYAEKNPEYNKKLKCEIKNGQLQFDETHEVPIVDMTTGEIMALNKEIKEIFQKRLDSRFRGNDTPATGAGAKQVTLYYSDIRKELQSNPEFKISDFRFQKFGKEYTKSEEELGSQEYIKQFEKKDIFVKLAGYRKIKNALEKADGKWERIKEDADKLDIIAEALTFCKSNKTRTEYLQKNGITDQSIIDAVLTIDMSGLASFSKPALKNLLKHMEQGALPNEAKEKCGYVPKEHEKQAILKPYSGFFEKNPVVARVISQTRKVINAILRESKDKYTIDQIHIEIATELANSKERKIDISLGQKRYKEAKERATERCKEKGINPEEGQNLLMFRLAEEQINECPYTGKKIMFEPTTGKNAVYVLDCEIDHIIPMSRSFNDSLNNKVLCDQKANQDKQDRIPYEWFEDMYGKDSQEWRNFENRVKRMNGVRYPKKKNLLRKSWTDEDKEEFLSRNLNDTRYAARHIADYLRKYFDFSKSKIETKDVNRIQVRSGGITAFLRHMWGLNKDRDKDDLHHAVDAIVVACSTYGHVFLVSNLAKEIEREGKSWFKRFDFLREKFKPWQNIREDILNEVEKIFVSRMPRHKVTAPAHDETIESLVEKRRIKKAKKKKPDKKIDSLPMDTNRVIKVNKGYAGIGEMVRADVFTDGNGKNYVVPIYAVDMFSKEPLPDKYLHKNDAPYETWPSATADNLKFKFSLFKDDLISINGEMFYINFIQGTRSKINVRSIDGAVKEKETGYKKVELKKYMVDLLGNYKEIKKEKRLGNEGVKRVKKPKKND